MAIPSKEEFDEVQELHSYFSLSYPSETVSYEDLDSVVPEKKVLHELFSRHYEIHKARRDKLEKLNAYKWLVSHYQWKRSLKAAFKTDDPQRSSKEAFVNHSVRWLLSFYKPMTTVDYYLYKQWHERARKKSLPLYVQHYTQYDYSESDVEQRYNKTYPLESFQEKNDPQKRLNEFNLRKTFVFDLQVDYEARVLFEIGDYFYDKNYLDRAIGKKFPLDGEEAVYHEKEMELWDKAYDGIDNLIPAVHNLLGLEESLYDKEDDLHMNEKTPLSDRQQAVKSYIDLLIQLEDIKERVALQYYFSKERLDGEDGYRGSPVIQRIDKTARERFYSYRIWLLLRDISPTRPVLAIEWLLQLEGIENLPDRRTIERWLQSLDREYKEEERQLNDTLFKLDV